MGDLVLDSLEIQGFRGFRHLQIEKLGRVNLIVGKNNVGKSSLLEALQIYAKRADPLLIWSFLGSRDERRSVGSTRSINSEVREDLLSSLRYLFYGRDIISHFTNPIQIGTMNSSENTLSLAVKWYALAGIDEQGIVTKHVLLSPQAYKVVDNSSPRFTLQFGQDSPVNYPLNASESLARKVREELKEINSVYAKENFLDKTQIGKLWDNIALTGLDEEVLKALRIMAPGVEGLTLVDDAGVPKGERERIPVVKIAGIDERLPLGHLGDGMQHILSVTLALVNSKDGILLIDEIENGLHYLVQPDLWHLVFKLAHRLNVQVFATTHSSDCIEAFQEAAQEDNQEGVLIRLQSRKGDISAVIYDEEDLKIVTREQIEVR
jgi:predicted ATPase